jgi:hypothetical protein
MEYYSAIKKEIFVISDNMYGVGEHYARRNKTGTDRKYKYLIVTLMCEI